MQTQISSVVCTITDHLSWFGQLSPEIILSCLPWTLPSLIWEEISSASPSCFWIGAQLSPHPLGESGGLDSVEEAGAKCSKRFLLPAGARLVYGWQGYRVSVSIRVAWACRCAISLVGCEQVLILAIQSARCRDKTSGSWVCLDLVLQPEVYWVRCCHSSMHGWEKRSQRIWPCEKKNCMHYRFGVWFCCFVCCVCCGFGGFAFVLFWGFVFVLLLVWDFFLFV